MSVTRMYTMQVLIPSTAAPEAPAPTRILALYGYKTLTLLVSHDPFTQSPLAGTCVGVGMNAICTVSPVGLYGAPSLVAAMGTR